MRAAALAVLVTTSLGLVVVGPEPAALAAPKPPKPVVTKISPNSGPTLGGTVVTIKGKNLKTAKAVLFGSVKGTQLKVRSDRRIEVVAPAHAEGVVDVKVQTRGGRSAKTSAVRFNFFAQRPQVTSISPTSGPATGGTVVTVNGTGFVGVTVVTFDGTAGTAVTVVSPTQLTVTSPPHAAYVVHLNVTSATGTSPTKAADRFLYVAAAP
jgi:IPT/TIG domain